MNDGPEFPAPDGPAGLRPASPEVAARHRPSPLIVLLVGGLLAVLSYVSARPIGPLPPLGPLLEPANGIWAVARMADLPARRRATIPGLARPVDVRYDRRRVPHLFASTPEDGYRALGYVVARDRLFQLEIQTRATAGTLTELLGPGVLALDQSARAFGLAWSADRDFAALDSTDEPARALAAYADGINGWIDAMRPRDLPIEYRLLNRKPMRWQPKYSLYLLKRMGWTLASESDELGRLRAAALVGWKAANALFPINSPIQEPIVAGPGRYPRYDWAPLPPPEFAAGQRVGGSTDRRVGGFGSEDAVGSNNWAVSPRRSRSGYALLAGDPHLELTLPSIWYEAHLVVPADWRTGGPAVRGLDSVTVRPPDRPTAGSTTVRPADRPTAGMDVYGVTIPGVPAVVIGFNRDVAWSFTNAEADVMDYFEETLDDVARPTAYRLDGAWKPLERRVEVFRGPRGELLATDTTYFTHRGPVRVTDGRTLSLSWTVLGESGETTGALLGVQRARTVDQWLAAMEHFLSPAQNGLVADRSGTIAVRSSGRFPYRAGDGTGTVIRDGTTSGSHWRGYWPVARYPAARDPSQGFLATANQQPVDPRRDPTYLGADWLPPWRALRINQLLRADSSVTPDAMRRYQTDPGSPRADVFVAAFLKVGRSDGPAVRRSISHDRGGRPADCLTG